MTEQNAAGRTPDLEAIALRQRQIVTRAQLLTAGVGDMQMYRQTRRGRWQRVLPATYALVTGVLTDEQRRISAALYAGASAQLTGLAALAWYGFRHAPRTELVQLVVPHHVRRRSAGHAVVLRALGLDGRARQSDLYPVCSPARAVVDAARDLKQLRPVRAIVAEAVQRGFTDLAALDEEVRRARRSRTALIRKALAEVVADFSPEDWSRTIDRHNALSRYGVLVLHFTPARIRRDPAGVRRTVEDAYRSRRGLGANCALTVLDTAR